MPLYASTAPSALLTKLLTVDGASSGLDADLLDGISSAGFDAAGAASSAQSAAIAASQPLDSDLTTLAGLTPTTNNFIVAVASAWASRTPAQAKTTLGLIEVVQFPINISVTAAATQIIVGSANTAIGPQPRRACTLVYLECSGNCGAAANTPELNIVVYKNLIPTGNPTPNTTNRAMEAKQVVAATTGYRFDSSTEKDSGMASFNGSTDKWSMGAFATGLTGTCAMSTFHIRLEFLLL